MDRHRSPAAAVEVAARWVRVGELVSPESGSGSREAMELARHKLPIKTRFISRSDFTQEH